METSIINPKLIDEFSKYMEKYNHLYQEIAEMVYYYIVNPLGNPLIVDLGVGLGHLMEKIYNLIPKARILGLDSSLEMLYAAQKRHQRLKLKNFEGIYSFSEKIPLKANSVDIVVSRFSLAYWSNPDESFREILRILKPGGYFLLEALNGDFPKWKLNLIKIHMGLKSAGNSVIKYHIDAYNSALNIRETVDLLSNAGLKVISKRGKKGQWKFILVSQGIL